jgi:hypothetical protein
MRSHWVIAVIYGIEHRPFIGSWSVYQFLLLDIGMGITIYESGLRHA